MILHSALLLSVHPPYARVQESEARKVTGEEEPAAGPSEHEHTEQAGGVGPSVSTPAQVCQAQRVS